MYYTEEQQSRELIKITREETCVSEQKSSQARSRVMSTSTLEPVVRPSHCSSTPKLQVNSLLETCNQVRVVARITALAITETEWADFLNNLICYPETPIFFHKLGATRYYCSHGSSHAHSYLSDLFSHPNIAT